MTLTLYYASGSCAFASLVALEEAGLPYVPRRLMLAEGEQRAPAFLAVNPRGRVPALVTEGRVITETIAILSYIAHQAPAAGLLPLSDALALARAYELMSWFASGIHVTIAQLWRSERFTDDPGAQRQLQAAAPARLTEAFGEIEWRLGEPWILGEAYSVVDPYLGVFYRWASDRLGLDMNAYPRWQAHNARLLARPAVQRALNVETTPAASATA